VNVAVGVGVGVLGGGVIFMTNGRYTFHVSDDSKAWAVLGLTTIIVPPARNPKIINNIRILLIVIIISNQ